jgi:elongation factor Ts
MSTPISPKDVMSLRNRTGLPMMACKKALAEAGGDVDAAEELMRKQLKGKMDKRVDRAAGEGRIAIAVNFDSGAAAIVELRAETDFTAKNDKFIEAAQKIAEAALNTHGAGEVTIEGDTVALVDDLRITTGENISVARAHKLLGETGTTAFGQYVHHDGKTGVLVQAEGSINEDTLRKICMHVTAAVPRPLAITADQVPEDVVEKERKFRIEQAVESGKPQEIAEKMVEGGMRKFFSEVALMQQPFVMDQSKTIADIVGKDATITAFLRWEVGEEV